MVGDLKQRTLNFGTAAMRMVAHLPHDPRGWVVAKQFGRCATSIGANVWEADVSYSYADFTHEISIARKEAGEALYWIELVSEPDLVSAEMRQSLRNEAEGLARILGTIVRRTQDCMRRTES